MDCRVLFERGKQSEFIKAFMTSKHLSQRKASNSLGVPRRSFRNWMCEKRLLPLQVLSRVIVAAPDLNYFLTYVSELRNANWGVVKGGRNCYRLLQEKYGEKTLMKRKIAGGKKSIIKKWVMITRLLPVPTINVFWSY